MIITPQLALRVEILGGIALVLFAVIFFRLWYLQVLSGDNYVAAARENRVRQIKIQAPRGEIVDRHGQALVVNRNSLSIKLSPDKLPARRADRVVLYRRLAKLVDLRPRRLTRRGERELKALPFAKPTIKQDVNPNLVAFVLERQEEFPGVEPERESLREYPHGPIGAHLFGQVGEVSPKQLKEDRFNGVEMGDRVGQAGIEAEYDRFLRGRNGAARVEVDALGKLTETLKRRQPIQGKQLRLSLDLNGESVATPFTRTVIVGSTNALNAPSPQSLGGTSYEFDSWSDGGAQSHTVVVSAPVTYTATYTQATTVGLQGGSVDIVASDWLWVSRERTSGGDFTFSPFTTALGSIMVPPSWSASTMVTARR